MPTRSTIEKAKRNLREGKSPSTAAGEFIHEEIEHVRRGKHGVRSPKQAIAIGLSEARRAGVPLPPPAPGRAKEKTRKSAERDYRRGQNDPGKKPAARYSRAREEVLQCEPKNTVSHAALSRQAREAARQRKTTASSQGSRKRQGSISRQTRQKAA